MRFPHARVSRLQQPLLPDHPSSPSTDSPYWFDALDSIGIDNMPKLDFRDNEDGSKADRVNNAMTPETKKALKERFGGTLPDVNFPSKVRAKMKQLLMIRALQDIESNGKLDEFGKSEIFRHALKMGDEYSPYLISG